MSIDKKIKELREITSNFLYIEYYTHENSECWKINDEFTKYNQDKLVLCKLDEGIEKALDLAIEHISKRKLQFNI
jgi:hypothetical protein